MWFRRQPIATLLILCSANICRSPTAAALMHTRFRALRLHRAIQVISAGTDAVPGMVPDPRMSAMARELNVNMRGLYSRRLVPGLLQRATAVYAMEPRHLEAARELADQNPGQTWELFHPEGLPIDDPYFGSRAEVRRVFEILVDCSTERAEQWQAAVRE